MRASSAPHRRCVRVPECRACRAAAVRCWRTIIAQGAPLQRACSDVSCACLWYATRIGSARACAMRVAVLVGRAGGVSFWCLLGISPFKGVLHSLGANVEFIASMTRTGAA